jgi:hypothetical protein
MDPQHPLGRVVSNNEERENDGSSGCMNLLLIHVRHLKGSDLLAHRTMIMHKKKRYTNIRN